MSGYSNASCGTGANLHRLVLAWKLATILCCAGLLNYGLYVLTENPTQLPTDRLPPITAASNGGGRHRSPNS